MPRDKVKYPNEEDDPFLFPPVEDNGDTLIEDDGVPIGMLPSGKLLEVSEAEAALDIPILVGEEDE